jgi:hypothetical protein
LFLESAHRGRTFRAVIKNWFRSHVKSRSVHVKFWRQQWFEESERMFRPYTKVYFKRVVLEKRRGFVEGIY